jgi:FkbM family methyltransferase
MKNLAFDIGAYNGNSIDRIRDMGYMKIVCVEPTPSSYKQLINIHKQNENLIVLNNAITDKNDDEVYFYVNDYYPFLNTMDKSWITETRHNKLMIRYNVLLDESHLNKISVRTITIAEMIKRYGKPDYIKIDVEGKELIVLNSFNEKIEQLSFEYISELVDDNVKCLERCDELGYIDFYISFNEELPFILNNKYIIQDPILMDIYNRKLNLEEAKSVMYMLKNYDSKNCIWGNVWCY